jgi:bromodomain-containing protein 7/9
LDRLLTVLETKDSRRFFAWPVTDQIAPGYSAIIARPMDFTTMRSKVKDGQYTGIRHFKQDFDLVCSNAQTYNQPATVYHKAASKLQHFGKKMMTADRLLTLRQEFPELAQLTWNDLARDFRPPQAAAAASESTAAQQAE